MFCYSKAILNHILFYLRKKRTKPERFFVFFYDGEFLDILYMVFYFHIDKQC